MIEVHISTGELREIAQELGHSIPTSLYPNVWIQIQAQAEAIKEAPLFPPGPIRLPADDPEQFLDWLRSSGFGHIAARARAITPPAPGDGP
jgi:hypothetical protein